MRQETAALRDFGPAYDRSGSFWSDPTWSRRSRHVRFAPIASVIWHHSDVTRRADCVAKVTAEKL